MASFVDSHTIDEPDGPPEPCVLVIKCEECGGPAGWLEWYVDADGGGDVGVFKCQSSLCRHETHKAYQCVRQAAWRPKPDRCPEDVKRDEQNLGVCDEPA